MTSRFTSVITKQVFIVETPSALFTPILRTALRGELFFLGWVPATEKLVLLQVIRSIKQAATDRALEWHLPGMQPSVTASRRARGKRLVTIHAGVPVEVALMQAITGFFLCCSTFHTRFTLDTFFFDSARAYLPDPTSAGVSRETASGTCPE